MDLKELASPFPPSDIEWRLQQAGEKNGKVWARCLAYITNRAIMQRLDDVCGPANWRNEYRHEANGAVMCGISIKTDDEGYHEWVTKWDGAENTDIEAVKGGLSSAMKRAAVQWGIGRYLYDLEEGFAVVSENGRNYAAKKEGKYPSFKWDPPTLPSWALPAGRAQAPAPKPIASSEKPEPSAQGVSDENKKFDGKRLGDYSSVELRKIVNKYQASADHKALVEACRRIMADRALGNTEDAKVERMKAGVVADGAELPF